MFVINPKSSIEIIQKKSLTTLTFSREDVLPDEIQRQRRRTDAERAVTLGKVYHGKLGIYFKTADGETKRLVTTIWAADAAYVTLKSGKTLPMRAVLGFDFNK